jgi:hypothetical protein
MKTSAQFAQRVEDRPVLPAGEGEWMSGYAVIGLPFASGHVLGLRRWTASSSGDQFTSIWHRSPAGRWTFFESSSCEVACTRYFGADVEVVREGAIDLEWTARNQLHISTVDGAVDWKIEMGSTPATWAMSIAGSALPMAAWRSGLVLKAMGAVANQVLGVGKVQLTGSTSNRQRFDANPLRIWYVTDSLAIVEAEDLGPIGPLEDQAHMADYYVPQRGIFAVGRVSISQMPGIERGNHASTRH